VFFIKFHGKRRGPAQAKFAIAGLRLSRSGKERICAEGHPAKPMSKTAV
jgi:hypothetical protein